MPLRGKVVITCAVTGSIHTPTMSPYLPADSGRDRARCDRRGGGGGGDSASPRPRPERRPADPRP